MTKKHSGDFFQISNKKVWNFCRNFSPKTTLKGLSPDSKIWHELSIVHLKRSLIFVCVV